MNKKVLIIIVPLLLLNIFNVMGQTIELNGFTGYQLGGKARLYDGDFEIDNAQNYGGKIAVGIVPYLMVEISFLRSDTRGRLIQNTGEISDYVGFSSNYIQLGGLQQIDLGQAIPYFTAGFGLAVWAPKTSALDTKTQFNGFLGAGLKLWLTDAVGIRLQATMLMPMVYNGVGFGCGIGTGGTSCGSHLYTRVTPLQGEFSGGLVFRFSRN